jgi:hypothetical protein
MGRPSFGDLRIMAMHADLRMRRLSPFALIPKCRRQSRLTEIKFQQRLPA